MNADWVKYLKHFYGCFATSSRYVIFRLQKNQNNVFLISFRFSKTPNSTTAQSTFWQKGPRLFRNLFRYRNLKKMFKWSNNTTLGKENLISDARYKIPTKAYYTLDIFAHNIAIKIYLISLSHRFQWPTKVSSLTKLNSRYVRVLKSLPWFVNRNLCLKIIKYQNIFLSK